MPSVTAHHRAVRQMPCAVTRRSTVTLHHCHGGSLRDEYPHLGRGGAQKTSDWLVIPLHADLHVGSHGIDYGVGVLTWEAKWGKQTDMLRWVSEQVGYDVFKLAEEEMR